MSQQVFNVPEIIADDIHGNNLDLIRCEFFQRRVERHRFKLTVSFHLGRAVHREQHIRHLWLGSQHGGQHLIQFGASHSYRVSSSSGGWASSGRNFFLSRDFSYASSGEIRFMRTCSMMWSSSGWLPIFLPTWIMPLIWCVLPSRTRLATAVLNTRISNAATRPFLSVRLNNVCATTPFNASESVWRILFCCSAGKTSMTRSTVLAALWVCKVPNTKWPVAAAVMASSMVSKSRISPTRTISGSSRSAPRSPDANDLVCRPVSRWLTRQFLLS